MPAEGWARQSARQFADAFQIISGTLPGAVVQNEGGLRMAYAGAPSPFFNYFFLEEGLSRREVAQAVERMEEVVEGRGGTRVLAGAVEAFGPEAEEVLASRGYEPVFEATGMRAERVREAERERSEDLQFSSRWGRQEIDEFVGVNLRANEMPLEEGLASVTSYFLLDPRCYPVVGRVGGEAVSAALAILLPEGLYLAWMATAPEWQGRGYGEATIREAIRRGKAASGHEAIYLHAPEPERALLRRLGSEAGGCFFGWGKGFCAMPEPGFGNKRRIVVYLKFGSLPRGRGRCACFSMCGT